MEYGQSASIQIQEQADIAGSAGSYDERRHTTRPLKYPPRGRLGGIIRGSDAVAIVSRSVRCENYRNVSRDKTKVLRICEVKSQRGKNFRRNGSLLREGSNLVFWRVLVFHSLPLIVAIGAALLLLLWIMGGSGVQGEGPERGYMVGMAALFLYPCAYQLLIIAWGVCRWRRWSLTRVFLQLIWLSLVLFFVAMSYALVLLARYL